MIVLQELERVRVNTSLVARDVERGEYQGGVQSFWE